MPLEEIDVLIATDCISEGQNLQDCDYLINYDIHWNPVRVIQRFGRIDRLGSRNKVVHLINFWPTKELDNYIRLKHRVEARMALVDIAATNEDNILNVDEIEEIVKDDLNYRDEQLKRLKEEILDLDDVFDNISFSEFTLEDFRVDLMNYLQSNEKILREAPLGLYSLVPSSIELENTISTVAKGVIFRFKHKADSNTSENINPLQPYYLVYIQDDGNVRYKFTHAKQILDIYRALCVGKTTPIEDLCKEFNHETKDGKDMEIYNKLLKVSIDAIVQSFKKRSMSLLTSSRNSILPSKNEQAKETDNFELVTWLVIK